MHEMTETSSDDAVRLDASGTVDRGLAAPRGGALDALGPAGLALTGVATATGIGLMLHVTPGDVSHSLATLEASRLGNALRDVHLWSSHLLVVGAGLALLAAFPRASHRAASWSMLVALVVLAALCAITGSAFAASTDAGRATVLAALHCVVLPLGALGILWRRRRAARPAPPGPDELR